MFMYTALGIISGLMIKEGHFWVSMIVFSVVGSAFLSVTNFVKHKTVQWLEDDETRGAYAEIDQIQSEMEADLGLTGWKRFGMHIAAILTGAIHIAVVTSIVFAIRLACM